MVGILAASLTFSAKITPKKTQGKGWEHHAKSGPVEGAILALEPGAFDGAGALRDFMECYELFFGRRAKRNKIRNRSNFSQVTFNCPPAFDG